MKKGKVKNGMATVITPLQGTGMYSPTSPLQGAVPMKPDISRNLSNYIAPVQLERIRTDIRAWRDAVREAEYAYYPQRVKLQRMYRDTILNGHVKACILKRKRLTTLRTFGMYTGDEENPVWSKEWTSNFKKKWFYNLQSYFIDAIFYGYSLVSLGSIVDTMLKHPKLIQRWNVSPDRFNVTSYIYATGGKCFFDEDVVDWHVYVDTPSEDGDSPCGYGLFYNIAIYEIILRNNLGFNTDFVERFSMPYVVAKTTKTNEDERGELEQAVANMGSAGYALVDPMDEITFLEAALAGTGWNGYDNLENRLEKKISKIILGHSDGIDTTPGKLGGTQDGKDSPVAQALSEIQSEDGRMIEQIVNDDLLPKLRKLGIPIPEDIRFGFKNDDELVETRTREDEANQATALVAKTLSDAGFDVDPAYITKRTNIKVDKKEIPEPLDPDISDDTEDKPKPKKGIIQNKLNEFYR